MQAVYIADLGFVNSLLRYGDAREGVHGPLDRVTGDTRYCVEDLLR